MIILLLQSQQFVVIDTGKLFFLFSPTKKEAVWTIMNVGMSDPPGHFVLFY